VVVALVVILLAQHRHPLGLKQSPLVLVVATALVAVVLRLLVFLQQAVVVVVCQDSLVAAQADQVVVVLRMFRQVVVQEPLGKETTVLMA
jgi:mannose-1-phosphate guanylyltransferase